MTQKYFLFIFFFLALHCIYAQEKRTISGFVTDSKTGEKLIGALIYDTLSKKSTGTNEYGFFSLSIPARVKVTNTNTGAVYVMATSTLQGFYEFPFITEAWNTQLFKNYFLTHSKKPD